MMHADGAFHVGNGTMHVPVLTPLRYILVALVLGVACGSTEAPTAPSSALAAPSSASAATRRVVVLGDSLAVSPSRMESFPAELQRRLERERPGWSVTNAGVSGDTTAGGARRVEALLGSDVAVLVVALGANDGLGGVRTDVVEGNLRQIIRAAKSRGVQVLLCGMETLPRYGWEYTLAFHEIYPRLAREEGVLLVPFLLRGVALVREMNGADGVHPNAAGARRIAENVWPYLEPLLTASRPASSSSSSRRTAPASRTR